MIIRLHKAKKPIINPPAKRHSFLSKSPVREEDTSITNCFPKPKSKINRNRQIRIPKHHYKTHNIFKKHTHTNSLKVQLKLTNRHKTRTKPKKPITPPPPPHQGSSSIKILSTPSHPTSLPSFFPFQTSSLTTQYSNLSPPSTLTGAQTLSPVSGSV